MSPKTAQALEQAASDTIRVPLADLEVFAGQSRRYFDPASLQALAGDLKTNGQLQPGVAWLDPGRNRLLVILGERRLRALAIAEMAEMEVRVIRGPMTQGQMLQMNLAENLQRASLNPIEKAEGFRRLMQLEELNGSQVAARLNISNASVSNSLALLTLPDWMQAKVAAGVLPPSVAAYIARTEDNDLRRSLAEQYEAGTITRAGVAKATAKPGKAKAGKPPRLVAKFSGLTFSVTGPADRFTHDNLTALLSRLEGEARTLHDAGRFGVKTLAASLKA